MLEFDLATLVADIKAGTKSKAVLISHEKRYHVELSKATALETKYTTIINSFQNKITRADAMVADPAITYYEANQAHFDSQYDSWVTDRDAYKAKLLEQEGASASLSSDLGLIQAELMQMNRPNG